MLKREVRAMIQGELKTTFISLNAAFTGCGCGLLSPGAIKITWITGASVNFKQEEVEGASIHHSLRDLLPLIHPDGFVK